MTRRRDRLLEQDQEARKLAHTEFETPLIIEAGAGTGKTALLTARAVAWCVGPGWERHAAGGAEGSTVARRVIERVVAITFTDAAAAEMAQRVGQALAALAQGKTAVGVERVLLAIDDDELLRSRCAALADEVHRLPASTFHSWCHRQLRRFPLEAGLHPMFEVDADGTLVEDAALEVVEEALRGLADDPLAEDWQRLAAAAVVPPRIAEALQRLVQAGVGPEALDRDPCAPDAVAPLLDRLRAGLVAFLAAEQGRLVAVTKNPTASAARDGAGAPARPARAKARPRRRWPSSSPGSSPALLASAVAKWGRGEFAETEAAALGDAAPAVAAAASIVAGPIGSLAALREPELGAARRVLRRSARTAAGATAPDRDRDLRGPAGRDRAPARLLAAGARRRAARHRPAHGRRVPGHRRHPVPDRALARPRRRPRAPARACSSSATPSSRSTAGGGPTSPRTTRSRRKWPPRAGWSGRWCATSDRCGRSSTRSSGSWSR